ncbi:terminase gpA endonuclease subunit [Methylobacterium organophilum]|uniref:Terminase n=1 Tax=Methylobacterium organophilum TaxID=410 RepID=A0ABQ4T9F6_METOR|nr:terminase gpA endonuclease subunit [Methylobacterium organophilum]GJE27958.1 hypothetical protein LKMONMHP_2820 [Methylobacterium organophilum]
MVRPKTRTTPDEWGAENRTYPASSGYPGKRNPRLTPYGIPFGRAVASRRYKRCVFVISAQSGKSETLLDIIGQRLDERPAPILYIGPNKQFIQEQWEPRVMALLDEAPTLASKVARGKRMTKTRKVIAGVPLRLAHAGSSTALKSDPASLALTDEADELMANVKGQGDPIGLIDARGDTYADFVHAMVSTTSHGAKETELDPVSGLWFWKVQPAESIGSTVWKFWQSGTRYHWTWKCPHCGERFVPRFDCLAFDGKGDELNTTQAAARASAHLVCPRNGCIITNDAKAEMNATGVEVAPGQGLDEDGNPYGDPPVSDTWSLWTSGLCSPFQSFGDRAAKYVEAVQTGDPAKIQTVINAAFGELWTASGGDAPDAEEIAGRKLPYRRGEIPAGVLFLTAGVDVQKDRLIFVIRGWGARQESWLIQYGEIFGDTRLDDTWLDLAELIENGHAGLPIRRVFIDSGFRPGKRNAGDENKVYEFCRRHARHVFPTKGYETRSVPISVNRIDVTPVGGKPAYGLDLVRLDSDVLKSWIHARVRWPVDQPGGWHIPEDAEEAYCRQIVSEARMTKPGGGFTWVRLHPDNHFLDCEALAYGAAKMIGLERVRVEPAPAAAERAAEAEAPAFPAPAPTPRPAAAPASASVRSKAPPGFMRRPTGGWLSRG